MYECVWLCVCMCSYVYMLCMSVCDHMVMCVVVYECMCGIVDTGMRCLFIGTGAHVQQKNMLGRYSSQDQVLFGKVFKMFLNFNNLPYQLCN